MLDESTSSIFILNKRLNLLKQSFNRLLNRPDSLEITATTLPIPTDFEINKDPDSLLSNHPKLVALEKQIAAATINENIVRKNGFPQIGLGIDYMIIQPQDGSTIKNNGKDALMPMFSLSIPIYRKKYQSQTREIQLYQKQLAAQKTQLQNSLALEWTTAQNQRFESQAQYDLDEQYDSDLVPWWLVTTIGYLAAEHNPGAVVVHFEDHASAVCFLVGPGDYLSLIHISEPTRPY